jgi:hypothetical protein
MEPYLQAVLLCEHVIEEKDGVISAYRICDGLIGLKKEPITRSLTALIVVRSDGGEGTVPVALEMETPSGDTVHRASMDALARGQNVVMNMQLVFKESGIHWFNIYLDNKLATRVPLKVMFMGRDKLAENLNISEFVKGQVINPQN